MKNLRYIVIMLIAVLVPSFTAIAEDTSLIFKDLQGPTQVLFGPAYTYSVFVQGAYKRIEWSAAGGKIIKTWWEEQTFFCEVQWQESTPENPAVLKVWGEERDSDEVPFARLQISQAPKTRSLSYKGIQSAGGKCLEIHIEDLLKDGGRVQIWECSGEIQQRWKLDDLGRLVNEGGKCLDVHAPDMTKDGGKVQVWECSDVPQQKWKLDEHGRLVNGGGKCLDVHAPDMTTDGGKVQIWECSTVDNQKWKIVD